MRKSTHNDVASVPNGGYDEDREFEFDDESVIWLNITRSGKGVKIVTPDGAMFISSIANIGKLVSGEYTGVKFTELIEMVS